MIITCPSCQSKYQYDEERFERKPSKKIKCARCKSVFDIFNPAFAPKEPQAVPVGDRTFTTRQESGAAKAAPDTTEQSPLPERRAGDQAALQLPTGKRLSLAILDGPDAGSVFRIDKPRITIGRSSADLTLNDSEASRQHAVVEIRDLVYTVNDLGSTNGTLIGGEKIAGAVELSDKSEFQVGATTLMLIVTDDA
ncbi:MAG TPA: FHA domain-containing protein [Thermoanaerobaculia bacterium]|nr:FHA domain-containing protein [Thermoanaerobaculia bacterium]